MNNLIIASHNSGKIREIKQVFSALPLTITAQSDYGIPEIAETGLSFVENALIKARHVAEQVQSPVLADDSGLVVPALADRPGLYSARYAGENADSAANIKKLLTEMQDIPLEFRDAYFYCIIVILRTATDPMPLVAQGLWQGQILFAEQGTEGFGYDPIFYVPTHKCSAAELDSSEKNRISHRGVALQEIRRLIENNLGG